MENKESKPAESKKEDEWEDVDFEDAVEEEDDEDDDENVIKPEDSKSESDTDKVFSVITEDKTQSFTLVDGENKPF